MRGLLTASLGTLGLVLALHIHAAVSVVQSTEPQPAPIGPQPIMLQAPCNPFAQLAGACAPGWVTARDYDALVGGHDI